MKRATEDSVALLTGAGIGMLAMYLLDPQSGRRRRRQIGAVTREAWEAAGETVGPVVGGIAEGASRIGRNVAGSVGEFGSRIGHAASDYGSRIGETASEYSSRVGRAAGDYTSRLSDTGRKYASGTGDAISEGSRSLWHGSKRLVGAEPEEEHGVPVVPAAVGGISLLALGAAAVWLFDPDQGAARRGWIRDKTFSLLRDAGDLARKTGRHISNQSYGAYAETRSYFRKDHPTDEQLVARVRSELGRAVSNMSNLSVTAHDGYVTLSGSLPQHEIQNAEAFARAVRGVRDVSVQVQPHVPQPQSQQPSAGGSGSWTGGGQTPAPAGG